MPNQDPTNQQQNSQNSETSFVPQVDLPPMPADFQNIESPKKETTSDSGSASPPVPNINNIVSSPKKKFGTGKIIATILGILMLVGGLGAGTYLVGQKQIFNQKAAGCTCAYNNDPRITAAGICNNSGGCNCESNWHIKSDDCPKTLSCISSKSIECGNKKLLCVPDVWGGHCGEAIPTTKPPTSTSPISDSLTTASTSTCQSDGDHPCVGNVPAENCYQGGTNNDYACYKLKGNPGFKIKGATDKSSKPTCNCPSGSSWMNYEYGYWWCFNTGVICDGIAPYAEKCSLTPQQCASASPSPGGSPPTNPPVTSAAPYCATVTTYTADWSLISVSERSSLTTGSEVNFCVSGFTPSGSFDMARFTINGVLQANTTVQRPGSTDFCQIYTIPSEITTVSVSAQIYHSTLGWF